MIKMVHTKNMQVSSNGSVTKLSLHPKPFRQKTKGANLVYAVKIKVTNDGSLKIGMYGEIKL